MEYPFDLVTWHLFLITNGVDMWESAPPKCDLGVSRKHYRDVKSHGKKPCLITRRQGEKKKHIVYLNDLS